MKLYFSPGACSLSPHIILCETGLSFTTEKTNLATKQTASGSDYRTINPKGSVPALQLDDGTVLTEGPAIIQYLADLAPEKKLAPAAGSMERYRLMEWLNFISSEVHKNFSPLFNPKMPEEAKAIARDNLSKRIEFIADHLQHASFLMGENFTVADAYLFTVLRWCEMLKIDLSSWPAVQSYQQRVGARAAVRAAMTEEGLLNTQ